MLGVVHDDSFGPVITCTAAGSQGQQRPDVAVRITPLSDLDAAELLRSLRAFPLLSGHDRQPPCHLQAAEDVLSRSALVEAHPEVAEVEGLALVVRPDGAQILDAHVRVQHLSPRPPWASLRK